MRIAFLLTSSLESPYGRGRCLPLARQMASQGHDVHIITLHHNLDATVARHAVQHGVPVHYAGQMHVRKVADTSLYFGPVKLAWVVASGAIGLMREAVRVNADVYHIGKPHPQNGVAGLFAARLRRRRRLVLDCDDLEVEINRFAGAAQRRVLAWLENGLPRRVDAVTVHSRFLESRMRALGLAPERILRLPSAVDPSRFQADQAAVSAWRRRLALDGRQVVIYLGTMTLRTHPIDLLLKAFVPIANQIPEATLLVVGGGADLDVVREMACELGIGDHCCFTGRVEPDDVPALLGLARVSADPVHDDLVARARWPLKIVESLAAGVPVVTGDVGDRSEMLGDGTAGLIVPPGDPEALAGAITSLLASDSLHTRLTAGCASRAGRYQVADVAHTLLAFYEQDYP